MLWCNKVIMHHVLGPASGVYAEFTQSSFGLGSPAAITDWSESPNHSWKVPAHMLIGNKQMLAFFLKNEACSHS